MSFETVHISSGDDVIESFEGEGGFFCRMQKREKVRLRMRKRKIIMKEQNWHSLHDFN